MKKIILALLVVMTIMLMGCQKEETGKVNPFVGGTTGVRMAFLADAPPAEVFDNGNFPFELVVELENVGETDVAKEDVEVTIKGIDPEEFGLSDTDFVLEPTGDLMGASKDAAGLGDGGQTEVSIEELSYDGTIVGAAIERPIIASMCYEYATKAVADLCVVKDILKDNSRVCTVGAVKEVFSSGAPIQVTSLTERAAGQNKLEFDFVIANQGSVSKIYKEGVSCEGTRSVENKVKVEVAGIEGITCQGTDSEGYVNLQDGTKTIRCNVEIDSATDYEKAITIDLTYAVSDDISTTLMVKHTE